MTSSSATDGSGQHPLAEMALKMLQKGSGEPYELPGAALKELTAELAKYNDSPELKHAVQALVGFAYFLDVKMKCPAASKAVLKVASGAIEPLKAQSQAVPEALEGLHQTGKTFEKFADSGGVKRANTRRGTPPQGSKRLGNLGKGPRRV